jgi:hypothetical protein
MPVSTETELVINLIGFPPGSARGVKQTLKPIQEAAAFRRTVNYSLKNTAPALAQKYATEISCDDLNVPCLAGITIGAEVVIDCVAEINRPFGTDPTRPVVEGSEYQVGDILISRPRLNITVTDFQWDTDETEATVGWRLTGEET